MTQLNLFTDITCSHCGKNPGLKPRNLNLWNGFIDRDTACMLEVQGSPLSTQTTMINHGILSTESVNAFLSYYYGTSQATGIHEATGTVTTNDRLALAIKPAKVNSIDDYYYRMLKAHEIIKAMAFEDDYVVLGTSKDKVRQAGNAVTPPVMQWLVERCIESLS